MTSFAALSSPSWLRNLLSSNPKFEKTRSIADELDGKRSNFSGRMISQVTLLLQFRMDVHHVIGETRSTHEFEISEAGNGGAPVVKAHKSPMVSGCKDISN